MKKIVCSIKGVLPLLQHKMSLAAEAALNVSVKKHSNKEDNPEEFLYIVGDKIVQPSEHILQAIIKQSANFKIVGRGKKTYKELMKGALEIQPEFIEHKHQKWVPDTRTVVNPTTKGRTLRIRPRFNEWELNNFTIIIRNDSIPIEVVKSALDDAGRESGLGDYRPRFGQFIVTKFEEK